MKNTDFLKLLCISNGYHRNIQIGTFKDDCGMSLYSVHAENDKFISIDADCGTFSDTIHSIVTDIANNAYLLKIHPEYEDEETKIIINPDDLLYINMFPWSLNNLPYKYLFNDEYRNLIIEKHDKLEKLKKREFDFEKNLNKYPIKPCVNCIEKIPTDIPCNEECELHYNMSCPKLRKWMDEDIPNYRKMYNNLEEVQHINQKFDNINYIYKKKLNNIKI